jgi:para-nitrobenzyl esterase
VRSVIRHLGIPYARAGRFELPEPVAFDPARDTSSFGPAAPQLPGDELIPGGGPDRTDEFACLTLNVWAPDCAEGLPVLAWIHGGSFALGASSLAMYEPSRFVAEQDVVIVSFNYRIGVLGFLDTRPLGGEHANFGLHDARLALEWIRLNIARFGGDPANVTIFGESAGGGMCTHLLAAPDIQNFDRAIVQSGITNYTLDPDRAAFVTRTFANALGVNSFDALNDASVDAILAAQVAVLPELLVPVGMMPFHPCIDGALLHDVPERALAGGAAANTGVVAGTTLDEMRLYVDPAAPMPDRDRFVRRVSRYTRLDEADAAELVATYEADLGAGAFGPIWAALLTDVEMTVPLRRVLDAQSKHQPAYAYLFDWQAPNLGAFHAVDLPFTFDAFHVDGWGDFVGADDDAYRIGRELRDAWAAFARTGDPGWPAYPATRVFSRHSHVEPSHPLFVRAAAL